MDVMKSLCQIQDVLIHYVCFIMFYQIKTGEEETSNSLRNLGLLAQFYMSV